MSDAPDYPNQRDCQHGVQRGKCAECDLAAAQARIAELEAELTRHEVEGVPILDRLAKTLGDFEKELAAKDAEIERLHASTRDARRVMRAIDRNMDVRCVGRNPHGGLWVLLADPDDAESLYLDDWERENGLPDIDAEETP